MAALYLIVEYRKRFIFSAYIAAAGKERNSSQLNTAHAKTITEIRIK